MESLILLFRISGLISEVFQLLSQLQNSIKLKKLCTFDIQSHHAESESNDLVLRMYADIL